MPRMAASGSSPDWARLYELAAAQAGYFTATDAAEASFSLPLLQHHLKAERLERAGRGVFRLVQFPPTDEEWLVPAWLWSGREGTFSHETALALHGLSDALPAKLHLTVPAAWRARRLKVPRNWVLHHADVLSDEREWIGPVPVTVPLRTVADCVLDGVSPELVEQAIAEGVRRRLFTRALLKQSVQRLSRER